MKTIPLLAIASLAAIITTACATTSNNAALDELNKGPSVFETQTPTLYTYSDTKPGYNDRLEKSWDELPPSVPHRTEEFLPVVIEDNQCLDCHDVPKYIDKPLNTDRTVKNKSPMSKEHYASNDLEVVSGARFNCTQCHVPLSDATPLVENTYR